MLSGIFYFTGDRTRRENVPWHILFQCPDIMKIQPKILLRTNFSVALNKNKRIFLECNHGNIINLEKIRKKACGKDGNTIK